MRAKVVIGVQTVIIALLFLLLVFQYQQQKKSEIPKDSLVSQRIYAGVVEPKSFLILNFVPLKKELQSYIQEQNLSMSVYVVNLRAGASMSIDSNRAFAPASLSKIPVAILIMRKVEEGKITLETPLDIQEADRDSTSGELYKTVEKSLPLGVLLRAMLQHSDNTAFRVFLRYLEKEDEEILSNYWDYFSADGVSEQVPQDKYVTPRSVYNLFASLYLSTMLEPKHSEFILRSMTNTSFNINKEAQLPPEVTVAHKFGVRKDDKVLAFHDCGIMYVDQMRIFYCVMTSGIEQKEAFEHTGQVVHDIYKYVIGSRWQLDQFKI